MWKINRTFTRSLRDFPKELVQNDLVSFGTNIKGYKIMYFRVKKLATTGLTDLHLDDLVVKWILFLISNYESSSEGTCTAQSALGISTNKHRTNINKARKQLNS